MEPAAAREDGIMRIEALKYQTDKKEDIIIFVDYNEVYSDGYHVQWSIADIAYRRPPSRNYIFLSDTYEKRPAGQCHGSVVSQGVSDLQGFTS